MSEKLGLIVGAGDVGAGFVRCLLDSGYRVIGTRRRLNASKELADSVNSDQFEVMVLGDGESEACEFARRVRAFQWKFDVVVFAGGKAFPESSLDAEALHQENRVSNVDAKRRVFEALRSAHVLDDATHIVFVSSRVASFEPSDPRCATQRGYRASIKALEWYAQAVRRQHPDLYRQIKIVRVPLVTGTTADEYIRAGIVSAGVAYDPVFVARRFFDQMNARDLPTDHVFDWAD